MTPLAKHGFFDHESSVGEIKNALSRINWAIILYIVAGVVGFMIKGGYAP